MKEDISLFYRRSLKPLLSFWKSQILGFLGALEAFNRFLPSKEKDTEYFFNYQYLLIKESIKSEDLDHYLKWGLDIQIISIEDADQLNQDLFYLVVGEYEKVIDHISYLRNIGIKVIWEQTFMKPDNRKAIWKRRLSVVEAIYADLITESIKMSNKKVLLEEKEEWLEDFEQKIFDTYIDNKNNYKLKINELLKVGWEWNRVNPTTIAILLEAISEYHSINTPKPVLITQSIKTAKNYCGEMDYKIINALLDNYFKAFI